MQADRRRGDRGDRRVRWERSNTRTIQRNGGGDRPLTTKTGDLDLKIPNLRLGSFFSSVLERRRRVDWPLFAVVMEAYVHGLSPPLNGRVRARSSPPLWWWRRGGDVGRARGPWLRRWQCQDEDEVLPIAAFAELAVCAS